MQIKEAHWNVLGEKIINNSFLDIQVTECPKTGSWPVLYLDHNKWTEHEK
jgi:hypothetical protein